MLDGNNHVVDCGCMGTDGESGGQIDRHQRSTAAMGCGEACGCCHEQDAELLPNRCGRGRFSIEAKVGNSVQITSLGYKTKRIEVKENMPFQKLTMADDAVTLKEVNVKSEKVKLSGDTIKYLLATYAQAGDRTLADVLKRVPGFEVDKESGQIAYGGKPISNFYIEGLDMLGSKYGVATNTLPQGEVASVEVIKHHQPVRVLEAFTFTNDDAVNIRERWGEGALDCYG